MPTEQIVTPEKTYTRRVHLCQSITGPLRNWKPKDWKNALRWINKGDGSKYASADELKGAFLAELAKGHEVVPIGDCDNFDYKKGCQGHDIETTPPADESAKK